MKPTKTIVGIALFVASLTAAVATPMQISYEDASALFNALQQIQPGLTAGNVGFAAMDIFNLKAASQAFQMAQMRVARDGKRAESAKDPVAAVETVQNEWDAFRVSKVLVDLEPMTLSDDEIKESKITPAIYAPILHYLTPPKK